MGTVLIMTVYRCYQGTEEDEGESEGDGSEGTLATSGGKDPIVNQLPAIETEKTEESFATTIPCPR